MNKKYVRANAPLLPSKDYLDRLDRLIQPVEIQNKLNQRQNSDGTIQVLETELAFLESTLLNISNLKKTEKFLRKRQVTVAKCLESLKMLRQEINQTDNPVNEILTNIPETNIIVKVEEQDKSNIKDFE